MVAFLTKNLDKKFGINLRLKQTKKQNYNYPRKVTKNDNIKFLIQIKNFNGLRHKLKYSIKD